MNWNKQRKDYPLAYRTLGVGTLHVFFVEYEIFQKLATPITDHPSKFVKNIIFLGSFRHTQPGIFTYFCIVFFSVRLFSFHILAIDPCLS